jgi:hypothetical protein
MKNSEELQQTYALLERLIADDHLFCRQVPGDPARQFALGAAAALHWALGNEPRPFSEMLAYTRKALQAREN